MMLTFPSVFCSLFFFLNSVLGFELRASHLLGRWSTTWATPPALLCVGFFQDRISWTICPGWLSVSQRARVTGVSHRPPRPPALQVLRVPSHVSTLVGYEGFQNRQHKCKTSSPATYHLPQLSKCQAPRVLLSPPSASPILNIDSWTSPFKLS
jgi:hypothetical protein